MKPISYFVEGIPDMSLPVTVEDGLFVPELAWRGPTDIVLDTSPFEAATIINHYLTTYNKTHVIFCNYTEGLNFTNINKMNLIVNHLLTTFEMKLDDIMYITGAAPTVHNTVMYHKHCEKFNWNIVPIYFYSTSEDIFFASILRNEIPPPADTTPRLKSKKMICFNGVARPQRLAVVAEIINRNILKDNYVSLLGVENFRPTIESMFDQVKHLLPNTYEKYKSTVLENETLFPLVLTLSVEELFGGNKQTLSIRDMELFNNSYFSLVTESIYFDLDNVNSSISLDCHLLSEKTIKVIAAKHPFILASRPNILETVRACGYKTFHPYINESYDTITDDELRLIAIMDETERLCNLTNDEYIEFQKNINSILDYNYEILKNKKVVAVEGKTE